MIIALLESVATICRDALGVRPCRPAGGRMVKRRLVWARSLFKIEDGRIRRIEAVMAGGLDHDASSGW